MPINNEVWKGPANTQEYVRQLEAKIQQLELAIRALGGKV